MNEDQKPDQSTARFFALPHTRMGWWAVGLAIAFFFFIASFFALVRSGQ